MKRNISKKFFFFKRIYDGEVFSSQKSILCNTHEEINEYLKSMSSENYYLYHKGMNERVIKSSFSVPLIANNKCLGTIAINNYKENESFNSEDLDFMEALANQASIAITNSRLFKQVEEKNEELNTINSVRSLFTKTMLENGGISQF
ncbi:GAF domain-containing protein [Sinobaca sp. H24]|uniref:GAF domain-containing protein n=1 Tax=Sinobaca sp. H24 TaxID=2923376 RepID=UPI0020795CF7|nr:GAF domain-containing protein [Sinobaca sp. H24]